MEQWLKYTADNSVANNGARTGKGQTGDLLTGQQQEQAALLSLQAMSQLAAHGKNTMNFITGNI